MNRKAEYVRLQTPLHYPGVVGDIGSVLPSQTKVLPGLEMTWYGSDGLVVSFMWQGTRRELAVPSSNVVVLALSPALKTEAEIKPKTDLKVVKSS